MDVKLPQKKMRDIKLSQLELELCQLLTTWYKFVWFDITSRLQIDFARTVLSQAP